MKRLNIDYRLTKEDMAEARKPFLIVTVVKKMHVKCSACRHEWEPENQKREYDNYYLENLPKSCPKCGLALRNLSTRNQTKGKPEP